MKLISPRGVKLSVSDERGEQLLKEGYTRPEAEESPAAPRKRAPRKTKTKD